MRVGVVFSQADSGVDPVALRQWAIDAEAAGYLHLLAYDHILGASADRLGPGPFGSFPVAPYTNQHTFHEILVLFSHLAAVTSTLEFVTSVLVLPQRQAPIVAKQVATIDLLSGGRLRLAVGVGWNFAEYEGLGTDFATREERLEEQIEVMRRLWTEPLVTFTGKHVALDRVGITPQPTRRIPVMIGSGTSMRTLRRVARLADGWMPLIIPGLDLHDVATGVQRLRRACEEVGRDPAEVPVFGRVYLGPGWQAAVTQAMELGFADLSVGFNRMANPTADHRAHLDALIAAKPEVDALIG